MNLDDVTAKVKYDLSQAGLREQIEMDKKQIAREWARENTDLETVLSLSRHIEYCEGKL
jgi:hypothetical protein